MQKPHLLELAREAFPDRGPARSLGSGQFNDAVLVGDVVLRFPRSDYGVALLGREAAILPVIAGRVPAQLPYPIMASRLDRPVGRAFLAQPLLRGDPLPVAGSPGAVLTARLVARFVTALHALPVQPALDVGVRACGFREQWAELRHDIESAVLPLLGVSGRSRARGMFDAAAELGRDRTTLVICHGDLGGTNLLYDPVGDRLAVLDWGFATVTDPVFDYASLTTFGEDLFAEVAAVSALDAGTIALAGAVRATFALQEALLYVRQGDVASARRVLADD